MRTWSNKSLEPTRDGALGSSRSRGLFYVVVPVWLGPTRLASVIMRVTTIFTAFVLNLLLIGCGRVSSQDRPLTDTVISNKIVGVWKVNETAPSGISATGTVSIFKDGSVTCDVKYVRGTQDLVMNYTASWQVENGVLIEAIKTSSNSNLLAVGFVTRDKVLSLDDQKFVFETEAGHKIVRERSK